ncbi:MULTISPECIES: YdgA family protein [Delftia]|uniref:DUF945 domain-containing protein n=3 Tax=Delftia tsuruhatensis TaxID=180282 RepID=A0ABN4SIF7_9BURK|nr:MULTISPECIES: YdgA family protein [Delftia]AOV01159.1 hypothetical protein BI380_07175 [Delftia tsuruhatensis]MDH2231465.1 YdgA family protein [Delftia tsuruhatensis]WEL96348.1 YdgA family protein [Delftia tsuruhatensis]WQM85572.1 YdgA family protein [Delftia tsuruhatensis]
MSNKKTAVAAAVALAVVAYGGTTWYTGQRAESGYKDAVAELRKVLGEKAVVTDEYHKGFLSSQAKLVLQWPAAGEADAPAAADAGAEAAPKPVRLVVDTTVRHGPLAGGRLAAAVSETRFALDGLDEKSRQTLAKAVAPTLTSVHHFTGGQDVRLLLPAGEMGDNEVTMRWQEMVLDTALGGGSVKGTWRWPEVALLGLPSRDKSMGVEEEEGEEEEESDNDEAIAAQPAAAPVERTSIVLTGLESSFENKVIDGLWGLGPGKASVRIARFGMSSTPAEGGEAKTLLDLKNVDGSSVIESDKTTLGMTTQVKGTGRIGPIDFESVGYEEKIQRLDIEALRGFQRVMVEGYRKEGLAKALESLEEQGMGVLMQNAPRLVAALPAYSMKLQATYQGQTGHLEYGAEVQSAPTQEQVAQAGWMPALLKTSALQANASLPKAWLEPLIKASGKPDVSAEDVEGMLGMAQATGYARLEGDKLVSALKMQAGQVTLNGKPIALPMGALQ